MNTINFMETVNLLNVSIDNFTMNELFEKLDGEGGVVFTPNVDHLIKLQYDRDFYEAYRVCDSQILMYASKFLGTPLKEKISGSDLFPAFYKYHNHKKSEDITIFLLGAAEGIAKKAQEKINESMNREIVIGAYSPSFGFEKNEEECEKIINIINQSGATVLAIGVGAPKQEKWLVKYRHKLTHIKIFLAIGATIDFEAGCKSRAPKWMSEVGIEWAYRLLSEPRRLWKRYLVDGLPFFRLIVEQKLGFYKIPFTIAEQES
jgi:N-acetylglucosaminyldiphosphoundecaprenol N-acetyl-beta-D-mannosaminyltransferase